MLTKLLIIISIILNPFAFLVSYIEPPMASFQETENQWSWKVLEKSLISAFWSVNPNFLPIRDWGINDPEIEAKAALVFDLNKNRVLYQKNINQILPIASLTKLMTGLLVLENLDLEEVVVVSERAIAAYGDIGGLVTDEKISVKNLLYVLLMESSNDAAVALAEHYGESLFVELMNQKAEELGLRNTYFTDPSGYDPTNVSTAQEITQLVRYCLEQPLIWQILKTPTIDLFSTDGKIQHHWVNTDELLNRLPNIIGGKTGYTEEAQGCLVLVIENHVGSPCSYIISVILGAQEKFLETERLIQWIERAYKW